MIRRAGLVLALVVLLGMAGASPALGVVCVGPDDPVGCDPLETPPPTPAPTPTPTPTPEPTAAVLELAPEDRERLDNLGAIAANGVLLLAFFGSGLLVTVGLRRG